MTTVNLKREPWLQVIGELLWDLVKTVYEIGFAVAWAAGFFGVWIYCGMQYGFLGFLFGWLAGLVAGIMCALVWLLPLMLWPSFISVVLVALALGAALHYLPAALSAVLDFLK